MGLHMYALTCRHQPAVSVDFEGDEDATILHYWRRRLSLHEWMDQLYRKKGGVDELFSCVNLLLTAEDLDQLEADVRARRLPRTIGIFFGEGTSEDEEDDLQFITKAREALATGRFVFYNACW